MPDSPDPTDTLHPLPTWPADTPVAPQYPSGIDVPDNSPRYLAHGSQILTVDPYESTATGVTSLPKTDKGRAFLLAETLNDLSQARDSWAVHGDVDLARAAARELRADLADPRVWQTPPKHPLTRQVHAICEQARSLSAPIRRSLSDQLDLLLAGLTTTPVRISAWLGDRPAEPIELAIDRFLWHADITDIQELLGDFHSSAATAPGHGQCSPADPIAVFDFYLHGPLEIARVERWLRTLPEAPPLSWRIYDWELDEWLRTHRPDLAAQLDARDGR